MQKMMKTLCRWFLAAGLFVAGGMASVSAQVLASGEPSGSAIEHLTTAAFREKVYDYNASPKEFQYKGILPAIVDFYADWCRPCRMLGPILEEVATAYKGQIKVYKVNIDKEPELAQVFGVQSIPLMLFIPKGKQPAVQPGLLQKEQLEQVVKEFLLKE